MGAHLRFDRIGWTYAGLDIAWNILLVAGMTFLWKNRQTPSLRMRNLPLLFTGVISLHIYGALCFLAYPTGALVNCQYMSRVNRSCEQQLTVMGKSR